MPQCAVSLEGGATRVRREPTFLSDPVRKAFRFVGLHEGPGSSLARRDVSRTAPPYNDVATDNADTTSSALCPGVWNEKVHDDEWRTLPTP